MMATSETLRGVLHTSRGQPILKLQSATARSQSPTKSRVALLHTEVPQELSGQGYGSLLAHGSLST